MEIFDEDMPESTIFVYFMHYQCRKRRFVTTSKPLEQKTNIGGLGGRMGVFCLVYIVCNSYSLNSPWLYPSALSIADWMSGIRCS
jgi:purine-cytosine permease-like protein